MSANNVVPVQALSDTYAITSISGSGVPLGIGTVVVDAAVVVGAAVVVDAAVVVGAAAVVDAAVVVGGVAVVVGATVVVGVAVSALPPHPEATNKNVRTTAYFLTV